VEDFFWIARASVVLPAPEAPVRTTNRGSIVIAY
jgi:hypothetical protein